MKPLRIVPANDTFRALGLMIDVLDGKCAGFIAPPEVNGVMPEVHGLPNEASENVGLIVESSGSTGTPKRIELSPQALIASAQASANRIGSGQWLLALPVNFIAGANVLIRSILADTQPVMMNTQVPFTVEAFIRSASLLHEPGYTSLVPIQLARLAKASESDPFVFATLRRFKAILVGGQQPDWAVVTELRSKGINVVVSYGMTETCGGCVYDSVPLDGVDISLVNDRIAISAPFLANGVPDPFVTSDLGEIIDGKLAVLGRTDRVIISGGIKISLDRIEQAALAIDGVSEVAAVAVPSSWGQSAALVYVADREIDFSPLAEISPAAKIVSAKRLDQLPRLFNSKPDLVSIQSYFQG